MAKLSLGLICWKCGSPRSAVVQTKRSRRHIVRHRKCKACGHRMKTFEIHSSVLSSDVKFDYLFKAE